MMAPVIKTKKLVFYRLRTLFALITDTKKLCADDYEEICRF